ncbi:hypothetical protein SLOPH_764 [Spraguea lophii 42_110]|uniref:Uncharacterized protein n=1 Tax=Spraguea lophii (strain 42_110) TaxID=1358809 RepID=S7W9A7_SPRLO|nr:hypothetical protein SLOPH_764 [Spraguea lophii 42_110]
MKYITKRDDKSLSIDKYPSYHRLYVKVIEENGCTILKVNKKDGLLYGLAEKEYQSPEEFFNEKKKEEEKVKKIEPPQKKFKQSTLFSFIKK